MASQIRQHDLYEPQTLEAVSQAFDSIWNILRADDPFRDYANDRELRTVVGKKLTALGGAARKQNLDKLFARSHRRGPWVWGTSGLLFLIPVKVKPMQPA
jgi:hypothetical protein